MKLKLLFLVLMILVLSSLASAITYYTDNVGTAQTTANTQTKHRGFKILTNYNIVGTLNVTVANALDTSSSAEIYTSVADGQPFGTPIYTTTTRTGMTYTFANVNLAAATNYLIVVYESGNSFTVYKSDIGSWPITGTNIQYIIGVDGDATCAYRNSEWAISNITSTNETLKSTITFTYPNATYNETYNNNYKGYINWTTETPSNCTINNSDWALASSNTTTFAYYRASTPDDFYTIKVNCSNIFDNDTKHISFRIDTVKPTIITNASNKFIRWNNNLSYYIDATDETMLWSVNVSIDGQMVFNKTNISMVNYRYNGTNTTYLLPGLHNITAEVFDAHTLNQIGEYYISKTKDTLNFDRLELHSLTATKEMTYQKLTDRYSFCVQYDTPQLSASFELPSDCIRQMTKYDGHYVCQDYKWVDFNNKFGYTITTDGNKVTATAKSPQSSFCFDSVGSLNQANATYFFQVFNDTAVYDADELEGTSTTFILTLETGNQSYTSDAMLWYNGSSYSMANTNNGSTKRNYSVSLTTPQLSSWNSTNTWWFNYTINGESFNSSLRNQTLYNIAIDNCTTYNTYFLNITFKDENTNNIILANISYALDYLSGTTATTFDNSFMWNMTNFCIYPYFANISTDITLQYGGVGYGSREYTQVDYDADNATETLNLFLLATSSSTTVTIHVIDDADKDLSNVLVEVYKWDVATSSYSLIGSELTNDNGNVQFGLYAGSTYYKFKFYQSGVLKLETNKFKIFDTTLEYILSETEATVLEEWMQIQNINFNLTFTNSTKGVNFTWYDADGVADLYCLNVSDNNQTFYNGCSSSHSGTIGYIITSFNRTYTATAQAKHAISGKYYNLKILGINLYDTFKGFIGGTESLMYGLIVFLTMSLIGLYSSAMAMVLGVGSLIILYWLQIVPFTQVAIMGLAFIAAIIIIITTKRGL